MNDELHKFICKDCMNRHICKYCEEYEAFLDGPAKEAFDIMPDFLEMQVNCKYRTSIYGTVYSIL